MKKNVCSRVAFMVMALLGCFLWSCDGKDTALLDSVPANSKFVALVNGKTVLANMGCTAGDEGFKLSESLKSATMGRLGKTDLSALNSAAKGIDIEKLVIFQPEGAKDPVVTFVVTDAAELDHLAVGDGKAAKNEKNGYTVYSQKEQSVLVKDDRGWLIAQDADKAVELADAMAEAVKDGKSVGGIATLNDFMSTTHAAGIVVNMAESGMGKDVWALADVTLDGNKIAMDVKWVKENGEAVAQDYLKKIDTEFLRYVPEDFNVVIAMGVKDGDKLADAMQGAIGMVGFQQRAMIGALLPYLRQVDGTVSIAMAAPGVNEPDDISRLKFMAMVKMPQAQVDEAISQINTMLGTYGARVEKIGDAFKATLQGTAFYVANVDGNLAIATVPIESTRSNSFASRVEDADMALSVILPSLGDYFRGAPSYGLDFSVSLKGSEMNLKCSFPDTKAGFLETLVSISSKM